MRVKRDTGNHKQMNTIKFLRNRPKKTSTLTKMIQDEDQIRNYTLLNNESE